VHRESVVAAQPACPGSTDKRAGSSTTFQPVFYRAAATMEPVIVGRPVKIGISHVGDQVGSQW